MSRKIDKISVKLVINGASATPAPPVGSALGPRGINLPDFCKKFNDLTKNFKGVPIRLRVVISQDKKFEIKLDGFHTPYLIKKKIGISSASQTPGLKIIGSIKSSQIEEIIAEKNSFFDTISAETSKASDVEAFNTTNVGEIKKMMIGTAKSMGIIVVD